jgi:hypothetical protein
MYLFAELSCMSCHTVYKGHFETNLALPKSSLVDPDHDPKDPTVFGPLGWIRIRICHNCTDPDLDLAIIKAKSEKKP